MSGIEWLPESSGSLPSAPAIALLEELSGSLLSARTIAPMPESHEA